MSPWINWVDLVAEVKAGGDAGMERLYLYVSRAIRRYIPQQVSPHDVDDQVHDTFMIIVKAVRTDVLREPDGLVTFVRTVVHRRVRAYIKTAVHRRHNQTDVEVATLVRDRAQNPEQQAITNQGKIMMTAALATLCTLDREILIRYYLKEEGVNQICAEMSLTATQFRLMKTRAKTRFGAMSRNTLVPPGTRRTHLQSLCAVMAT